VKHRFWLTLLWDLSDTFLTNILDWIAALAILSAFLLVLR
jgi:hypothetical protein